MSLESDAKLLAEAIMDKWKDYDDSDYSPKGYYCTFCYSSSWKGYNKIVHDLNCPVLVSKDVLTK